MGLARNLVTPSQPPFELVIWVRPTSPNSWNREDRIMRVFCPVHRKSFSAPRRNPIRCENKAHVLGELDFEGRASEPASICWEYCCNCEHFWPGDFDHDQCPVCNRQISARYLCDQCYTFSLESLTPAAVKNFTLTTEGAPYPACPGCLQETATDVFLQEHQCPRLGASFITGLRSCPICKDLIEKLPSFPTSNAEYLRQVKTHKNVGLDYEKDMLVEAEGGEFVLITHRNEPNQPILLPRLVRFTKREDFYESYQDYYHCLSPSEGEVIIIRPAVVEPVEGGWKLQEAGILQVDRKLARAEEESRPSDRIAREHRSLATAQVKSKCFSCGAALEPQHLSEWDFCWNCGEPLASGKDSSGKFPDEDTLVPSQDKQTPAAQPAPSSFLLSILEPAVPEPDLPSANAKAGRLLLIGLIGLVVIGAIIWLILRSASPVQPGNVTNTQQADAAAPSAATAPTPARTPTTRPEDDEILTIRKSVESLEGAPTSERLRIIEELQAAERKYSADYRFPYERAKLSIKGVVAHDEAFTALLAAAERAMSTGKAKEMLSDLMTDKDTYFWKTSRGHEEWNRLVEALKNEDRRILRDLATGIEKKAQH